MASCLRYEILQIDSSDLLMENSINKNNNNNNNNKKVNGKLHRKSFIPYFKLGLMFFFN